MINLILLFEKNYIILILYNRHNGAVGQRLVVNYIVFLAEGNLGTQCQHSVPTACVLILGSFYLLYIGGLLKLRHCYSWSYKNRSLCWKI